MIMASAFGHFGRRSLKFSRSLRHILQYDPCSIAQRSASEFRLFHLDRKREASIPIQMPALSPTMTEGTIVKWHKKEGDPISPGDVLCDIQTDKAVVSLDTEEEGVLAKILKQENTKDVLIGSLIAVMVEEGDDWENAEIPTSSDSSSESSQSSGSSDTETTATPTARIRMSPAARKLLEEYNISSPHTVPATGPHGMINKGDVLKYAQSKNLSKIDLASVKAPHTEKPTSAGKTSAVQPAQAVPRAPPTVSVSPDGGFQDIETTSMRRVIAQRLTQSKTMIPHSYMSIECNVDAAMNLRKKFIDSGTKVSLNDIIVKAAGYSLQRVPKVNSHWAEESVQVQSSVDISVAVATDSGLITPIIRNAVNLSISQISTTTKELAVKAREGKLQLQEFQGGSFTISNLGMFGIGEFSAIINPPQTAVLAVGTSELKPSVEGKPHSYLTVKMSYDSRAIDESEASEFLEKFQSVLENPSTLLV
ncbi:pyruvate dehydrogenase protein X component, mitochondrial-like [Ostrea edulis]|uniref:pyruvate dehydrogenase protein X component, mitochondrial-like n=1 Tax=Ostrea edulis TaxID=37623 RepID=UPI0024AF9A77|nr:pyruvate dehydrogenase protein X component, mitochondrial-like [Ostrea edulis]